MPREERIERVLVLLEDIVDGESSKRMPRFCGEGAGVVDGAGGGELAGHADAEDVLRAEGLDGDGGDQRGVDAAAEADEGLGEAALADVVAGAEDERVPGGGDVVGRQVGRSGRGLSRAALGSPTVSKKIRSSAKEAAWAMSSPSGARTREEPSKMRESLPPTWLTMTTKALCAAGDGGEHVAAEQRACRASKGEAEMLRMMRGCAAGAVSVPLAHQLVDRVDGVEAARPEALVVPGVLADGDGERLAVESVSDCCAAGSK